MVNMRTDTWIWNSCDASESESGQLDILLSLKRNWCQFCQFLLYKYGKRTRDFGAFLFLFWSGFLHFGAVYNRAIILLALIGHEMIIANSALRALLATNHPLSNARSWNNCWRPRRKLCAGASSLQGAVAEHFIPSISWTNSIFLHSHGVVEPLSSSSRFIIIQ